MRHYKRAGTPRFAPRAFRFALARARSDEVRHVSSKWAPRRGLASRFCCGVVRASQEIKARLFDSGKVEDEARIDKLSG
jgi:hypothetical protein